MALVLADRVQQTGTANTTVSFTLSGSVTGFQSFSVVGNTNTTYYAATDTSGNWESGLGTYSTTGPTLTRTTILASSNAGSAVTFSGTVTVFCTYPSSRALYLDGTSANINVSQAAFTANGIPYASSTTALATGSALTFNGTNLTTTGSATAARFIPTSGTAPADGIYSPASGVLGFSASAYNIVRMNSVGLGISTAGLTPTAKLHVSCTSNSTYTATTTNGYGIYNEGGLIAIDGINANVSTIDWFNVNSLKVNSLSFNYIDFSNTTVTNAATLYIEGPPSGSNYSSNSTSISTSFPLYVASGTSYFGNGAILGAGTTSVAPLDFTAGSLLTTPVEGAMEFDGTAFYTTDDTTDGRGYLASIHYFRLAADVTAFGPAIGNFFGATSGMALDAGVYYEVEAYLYFTKTTAGTVTFTMTFTQGPANNDAHYIGTPVGGIGTVGAPQTAAIAKSTATAGALPVTGTLTTAVNHQYTLRSMFRANATTGGTFNIQITSSAGTVTPLTGSYYKLTRLPATNTGAFV
jgi:hypothetical protein